MLANYLRQFDALVADRLAQPRALAVLAALFLLFTWGVFPALAAWRAPVSGGQTMLDTRFSYSASEAQATLAVMGEEGRWRYLVTELSADLLYPVIACLLLGALIAAAWRRARGESWNRRLARLPLVYLLADYSENAGVTAMLVNYPAQMASAAQMTALFTTVKWALVAACVLVVAGALLARARGGAA